MSTDKSSLLNLTNIVIVLVAIVLVSVSFFMNKRINSLQTDLSTIKQGQVIVGNEQMLKLAEEDKWSELRTLLDTNFSSSTNTILYIGNPQKFMIQSDKRYSDGSLRPPEELFSQIPNLKGSLPLFVTKSGNNYYANLLGLTIEITRIF